MSETQSDTTTTPEPPPPPPPPPPPTTSNTLWDVPNNSNYRISTRAAVDTRFRLGYPMLPPQGPPPPVNGVASDLKFARNVMTGLPASSLPAYPSDTDDTPLAPDASDPFADVKRSLSYSPSTGINFITGASFTTYLRNNFDTRIGDGAVLFRAVDQSFSQDGVTKPGLTYFRLGKPEPRLTNAANVQYERADDQLTDQKYKSGIGIFSDGGINAWTRDPINMRSDEAINLIAPSYCLSTYGESLIVSYEIDDDKDIERINAGDLTDQDVNRRIINVNALRSTPLGWYRQIFDRGRNLNYSTSNKGEFSIGASYGLSVGAKFEHSIAVSFGTSLAGKVEINDGFGIEIGASGAAFKGFSGVLVEGRQR